MDANLHVCTKIEVDDRMSEVTDVFEKHGIEKWFEEPLPEDSIIHELPLREIDMKEKFIESIQATRNHFEGKKVTPVGYFKHLEEELRNRQMGGVAEKLDIILKEKIQEGVFSP